MIDVIINIHYFVMLSLLLQARQAATLNAALQAQAELDAAMAQLIGDYYCSTNDNNNNNNDNNNSNNNNDKTHNDIIHILIMIIMIILMLIMMMIIINK